LKTNKEEHKPAGGGLGVDRGTLVDGAHLLISQQKLHTGVSKGRGHMAVWRTVEGGDTHRNYTWGKEYRDTKVYTKPEKVSLINNFNQTSNPMYFEAILIP